MKITEDALPKLIRSLRNRFEDGTVGGVGAHGYRVAGRRVMGKLHDQIAWRRAHFFNMPEADPVLPPPYDDSPAFQSDAPRQKHTELKARVVENHFKTRVESGNTTVVKREAAQAVETYLLDGMQELEDRLGYSFQEAMADCQIIDGVGFLHWRTAHQKLPEYPDYEYRDDLKDTDKDEKKRYRPNREYTEGSTEARHKHKLRETDDSLHERRRKQLAEAPFPYEAEVVSGRNVYWVPDRSCLNGFGMVMTIQTVGWLDYESDVNERGLRDEDGNALKAKLEDANTGRSIRLYTEVDAPFADGPSIDGWDETISIVTIWTRGEWYELASCGTAGSTNQDWTYITGGTHEWEMPPFAIVTAISVMDPDPALAYPPALAGMYRLKPFVDEATTLMHVISRNIAMPWFFLQRRDDGASLLTEDGKLKTFTWDAAAGMTIPDGYELKWVDTNLNTAYPQSLAIMIDDYKASFPSTGTTDTSASSQPWTVRLKQQEANVTPRQLIMRQVQPLDIMVSSIAKDCARRALDEPDNSLWAYVEDEGKKKIAAIPATDLKGLECHIDIDATSAAERVTEAQLGMQLMEMQKITDYQFWDEFWGDPDPQKRLDEVTAEQTFKTYWLPGIIRQRVARIQGSESIKNVSVGVGGELLGPNGQGVQPDEVLAMNGVVPQQAAPAINGQGPSMPGAGTLATEGTVPIGMGVS